MTNYFLNLAVVIQIVYFELKFFQAAHNENPSGRVGSSTVKPVTHFYQIFAFEKD